MGSSAWSALLDLARRFGDVTPPAPGAYGLGASGSLRPVPEDGGEALVIWRSGGGWRASPRLPSAVRDLLDLYLPLFRPRPSSPLVVAHLGQSLDGHIATESGDSRYVTGAENILHLHRMRALCDAVVVGAETVAADDPRLTTRLVPGSSPLRVVLDPRRRLSPHHRVFTDDQVATLLVRGPLTGRDAPSGGDRVDVLRVSERQGKLDLAELLARLGERGIGSVFVEGGGKTVTGFLEARLLDRLQVTVAPLLIGSGRPGLTLAGVPRLQDCLHPAHRIFRMGGDILFDLDLRAAPSERDPSQAAAGLQRIV